MLVVQALMLLLKRQKTMLVPPLLLPVAVAKLIAWEPMQEVVSMKKKKEKEFIKIYFEPCVRTAQY